MQENSGHGFLLSLFKDEIRLEELNYDVVNRKNDEAKKRSEYELNCEKGVFRLLFL
jgi:peptide methionine sulfoxide reductase MsrB